MTPDQETEIRSLQALARSDETLRSALRDAWSLGWGVGLDGAEPENPFYLNALGAGASS